MRLTPALTLTARQVFPVSAPGLGVRAASARGATRQVFAVHVRTTPRVRRTLVRYDIHGASDVFGDEIGAKTRRGGVRGGDALSGC